MPSKHTLLLYARLIRLDKPVGILLLLWPTLIALWLASDGKPDWQLVLIFSIGTILMRSAGCAINDFADQEIDKHVQRTAQRPLASGQITPRAALLIALLLALLSYTLILPLNTLTKQCALAAVIIAATYPYFKRFFAIPQAYLGIAFGFGIPMAFAAVQNTIPVAAWLLLIGNIFWAIAYDTEYAIVDRDDDLKIGIKTSAITFGRYDVLAIMLCYFCMFAIMLIIAWQYGLRGWFLAGWLCAIGCAIYHYFLIRHRQRQQCFMAFRHNNWLGAAIFSGIALDYALR